VAEKRKTIQQVAEENGGIAKLVTGEGVIVSEVEGNTLIVEIQISLTLPDGTSYIHDDRWVKLRMKPRGAR
jgi:hypothetical protein